VSNNKNQLDSYAYDANGNLTNDQLGHTFTYDAENRPYSGGGANYFYDGEGERVAKSTGTLYWFGTSSAPVPGAPLLPGFGRSGNSITRREFSSSIPTNHLHAPSLLLRRRRLENCPRAIGRELLLVHV